MAELESVLIVGERGREPTLIKEALDRGVSKVYSTRAKDAVDIGIEGVINTGLGGDINAIASFAHQERIKLVIVGPEAPLVGGIGDILRKKQVSVFGPNADGAEFEGDKTYTDDFVKRYGLPNPDNSESFKPHQRQAAKDHISEIGVENVYTKRVGQEDGKGAKGYEEGEEERAFAEVDAVADKGEDLLIQGRLRGLEYSAMVMLGGLAGGVVALPLARDHKSLFDGGKGPNTGGVGAWAPLPFDTTNAAEVKRRDEIVDISLRSVEALKAEGIDFRGTLFLGLMAVRMALSSPLKLIEYNVRFGDPEAQVQVPALNGHAIDYMLAAAHGSREVDMSRMYLKTGQSPVRLAVYLSSPGYAQEDKELVTGLPIHIPKNLPDNISLQFAGARMVDGIPTTSGGRILSVTIEAPDLDGARQVYNYIGRENNGIYIGDDQQLVRSDIGLV